MFGITQQDYQGYAQLDGRVRKLELGRARYTGAGQTQQGAQDFILACTCPPSTAIIFRGGLAWWSNAAFWPAGFLIPTYRVDLAEPAKCSVYIGHSGYTYTFTNANWYVSALVVISNQLWAPSSGIPPYPETVPDEAIEFYSGLAVSPYFTEYETAEEAEVALRAIDGDYAIQHGIVAGGIVLRNNGNVAAPNQYMPVDPVNRGRSYLFGARRVGWQMG